MDPESRQKAIYENITLPTFKNVSYKFKTADKVEHTAEFSITQDALSVGGIRFPMSALLAQRFAQEHNLMIPTSQMVDHVFADPQFKKVIMPTSRQIGIPDVEVTMPDGTKKMAPNGKLMRDLDNYEKHSALIDTLVDKDAANIGAKKIIVISPKLEGKKMLAFHGGLKPDGSLYQKDDLSHEDSYEDYVNCAYLAKTTWKIDGQEMPISKVIKDYPGLVGGVGLNEDIYSYYNPTAKKEAANNKASAPSVEVQRNTTAATAVSSPTELRGSSSKKTESESQTPTQKSAKIAAFESKTFPEENLPKAPRMPSSSRDSVPASVRKPSPEIETVPEPEHASAAEPAPKAPLAAASESHETNPTNTENFEFTEGVKTSVLIKIDKGENFDASKPTILIPFATANANTIQSTENNRNQELGPQIRALRASMAVAGEDKNIVIAYMQPKTELAWRPWTDKNGSSALNTILDEIKDRLHTTQDIQVNLAAHSGGGNFISEYMKLLKDPTKGPNRIQLYDANYWYSTEYMAAIENWLAAKPDHKLQIISHDDSKDAGGKNLANTEGMIAVLKAHGHILNPAKPPTNGIREFKSDDGKIHIIIIDSAHHHSDTVLWGFRDMNSEGTAAENDQQMKFSANTSVLSKYRETA